jgi:PD-(D/E)XK nuclease superfamily
VTAIPTEGSPAWAAVHGTVSRVTSAPAAPSTVTFADLSTKWQEVLASVAHREAREAEMVVAEWSPRFLELLVRQLELKRAGQWLRGRADFLGIMLMERAEIRHSRMIAWLLDPLGHHGLRASVLRGLLERCFPGEDFEPFEEARPECEVVRGAYRADIVVWLSGRTLVIENKVNAPESIGQCDGLCREFTNDPDPHYVFLTPQGRPPENSTGPGRERFRPMRYRDLCSILRSALSSEQQPGQGRHIAEDYLRTLELEFR